MLIVAVDERVGMQAAKRFLVTKVLDLESSKFEGQKGFKSQAEKS